MDVTYILIGAVAGAVFLFAGFCAGWYIRDRARGDFEVSVPMFEGSLHDPIDIPIAGRYVEKKT